MTATEDELAVGSRVQPIASLISDEGKHTGASGYPVISQYLGSRELIVKRSTNPGVLERSAGKLLRFRSASGWYAFSSFCLELKAWRARSAVRGFHLMWADRDWGYLDRLPGMLEFPLIGTFHACPDDFKSIIAHPERLRQFAAVILMSEVQRQNFVNAGVAEEKVHVVLHGIDATHFTPATRRQQKNTFDVLHVGSYRRNFDVLISVCKRLRPCGQIKVKIIAPPQFEDQFASEPNVEFLSGLSNEELLAAYQQSDCLLMTAKAATANNAIVEGMACALPVVAENVGGISEYVNLECSTLCDAGDAESLAAAVVELYLDEALRTEMGSAARARAEVLDWSRIADQTQAIYDRVLCNRGNSQ